MTQSGYPTAEVARVLELPARKIRELVRSGLVSPARGLRGEYRFSFPDLVVLRTARELLAAGVPFARVRSSLANLAASLPVGQPLTSLRVLANGDRVLVQDGSAQWDAESSQILLDFQVSELAERIAPLARDAAARGRAGTLTAQDWFDLGCDLEMAVPDEARDAYRRALEIEPGFADAHVNLGRLLHEIGEVTAAEQHYRQALELYPANVTAIFNLGVALEDLGRLRESAVAYREAIVADPDHADAHFNLAGVLERTGQESAALKHLKAYRQLIATRGWNSDGNSL